MGLGGGRMRHARSEQVWFTADFETTGPEFFEEHGFTKVWLWAVADSNGNAVTHGEDIDSFMQWCRGHHGALIYFHNLRFDGSFILNWLLANGFEEKESGKLKVADAKGFETLIDGDGAFYMIKVNLGRRIQVTFQDSQKVIPLSIKSMGKAFGLPIEKESIDYSDYTVDDARVSYVEHDVRIDAMGLGFFRREGFDRMTIGSNAYNDYKTSIESFEKIFPRLDREWLRSWRGAYRGGRTQVNPRFASKVLHGVARYDINSMYPYCMSRMPMPFGAPIKQSKPNVRKFELYEVEIAFKLKKGHLPTLLKKGALYGCEDTYYTETEGIEVLKISNIDLEILKRHYRVSYLRFREIWGFQTCRTLFTDWVDEAYLKKANSEGGMRMLWKLLINNLYGKFGTKPYGRRKRASLGAKGELTFEKTEEEEMGQYYLPVAIAVTSWAHKMIDDAICETGLDAFVYCDTDSVHTLGTLPDEWVDPKEIGKFKLEAVEDTAKYIRQKCYVHKDVEGGKAEYTITCAGMTQGLKDWLIGKYGDGIFDEFEVGLTIDPKDPFCECPTEAMKLRPKQVRGGCILVPTGFRIR